MDFIYGVILLGTSYVSLTISGVYYTRTSKLRQEHLREVLYLLLFFLGMLTFFTSLMVFLLVYVVYPLGR